MPLPTRNKDEDAKTFVSRCISSDKMNQEYPSTKQRTAVCLSRSGASAIESADITYNIETFGYTEDVSEANFYVPQESEYVDFNEQTEEWDISTAKPGLWENIRKKKEREGDNYKPAKRGDPDRPHPESWKKAQNGYKYKDPKTGEVYEFDRKGVYTKNGRVLIPAYSAEYQGRKVTLNKPFRTPDGPKKFAVYTKNGSGKVVIVRFGDPNMEIKRDNPKRRKSFRARHKCDTAPGPKWKARYWSCRMW
jgi:hypothetical protein